MLDHSIKLFNGEMTYQDILNMDIEDFKDIIDIRAEQRRKSLERYNETGEKDLYVTTGDSQEAFMQVMLAMMGHNPNAASLRNNNAELPPDQKVQKPTIGQRESWNNLRASRGLAEIPSAIDHLRRK